jgi:SAM-dependent methyltransferase
MSDVFGATYAGLYDLLYSDKDYEAECDLVHRLLQRYGNQSISSIVDFGCGTGNHAFPLSHRGYDVVGVERSENMLVLARRRLARHANTYNIAFHQGDIRNVQIGRAFDSALMMFAVLGYQIENEDVLSTLKTARAHLREGGLLIFDVWYGPAVLHQRPSDRIKVTRSENESVLRAASGELDIAHHRCLVRFQVWRLAQERVLAETEESHMMRFFFPLELQLLLAFSGFTLIRLGAFPDFDADPGETTWNVLGVARAV